MKLRMGKGLASSSINFYQVMAFSTNGFTLLNENRTLIQFLKFCCPSHTGLDYPDNPTSTLPLSRFCLL
jgi:hypothetical protein